MAEAISRLQGEWQVQSGAELVVHSVTGADLLSYDKLHSDAVIVPSHMAGPLVELGWVKPLPQSLATASSGDWTEVFELLRQREATWGSQVIAVPFGSPVFVVYYRPDLLQKLRRNVPKTWTEYQSLAEALSNPQSLEINPVEGGAWSGTLEPLGPGWAGLTLLARAAAYAKHPSNYSTVFDIRTMEPLVGGPPFVRALEELVAVAQQGSAEQLMYSPDDVRRAFWSGQCGMAITWPTAADSATSLKRRVMATEEGETEAPLTVAEGVTVAFAELPGSPEVFDVGSRTWSRREGDEVHVPLVSISGRVGIVSAGSQHSQGARNLLMWLSSDENSVRVSAECSSTTLYRTQHLQDPESWLEPPAVGAAAPYALLTERTLSRQQSVSALPIPGRAEYLSALDEAVGRAVRREVPPREALIGVSAKWQEITERLGREKQRKAYLHSLGLSG
ncbi:MAG: ABC transporter substrate-binding protein [Planctomycetota bacterium]